MNIKGMTPILTSVGFGMVSGFLIGFAIKKVMKILGSGNWSILLSDDLSGNPKNY